MHALGFWGLILLLSPLLAVQAAWTAWRTPRLPEAEGARQGCIAGAEGTATMRLLVAGESTATGVGVASLDMAVAGRLAAEIAASTAQSVHWQVIGVKGARVHRLAALLRNTPPQPGCALALVPMGVNDTVKLTSLARWQRGLAEVTDVLRGVGITRIAFAPVPPVGWFTALPQPLRWVLGMRARQLDRALLEWTSTAGEDVCFLPINLPMAPQLLAEDGYHPGEEGYRLWASLLADELGACGLLEAGGRANGRDRHQNQHHDIA